MTRTALPNLLLLTIPLRAEPFAQAEDAETAAIRSVVAAISTTLNHSDGKAFSAHFTADGDLWMSTRLVATGRTAIQEQIRKPDMWTEVTAPLLEKESVRLLSRELALVDANMTRYGSLTIKETVPVTMLMKKQQDQWLLLSMRMVPMCTMPYSRELGTSRAK